MPRIKLNTVQLYIKNNSTYRRYLTSRFIYMFKAHGAAIRKEIEFPLYHGNMPNSIEHITNLLLNEARVLAQLDLAEEFVFQERSMIYSMPRYLDILASLVKASMNYIARKGVIALLHESAFDREEADEIRQKDTSDIIDLIKQFQPHAQTDSYKQIDRTIVELEGCLTRINSYRYDKELGYYELFTLTMKFRAILRFSSMRKFALSEIDRESARVFMKCYLMAGAYYSLKHSVIYYDIKLNGLETQEQMLDTLTYLAKLGDLDALLKLAYEHISQMYSYLGSDLLEYTKTSKLYQKRLEEKYRKENQYAKYLQMMKTN